MLIIVIILLITLAFVFIRGIISNIPLEKVFTKAQTTVIDNTGKFSSPQKIEVKPGSSVVFETIVGHDGSVDGPANFDIQLTPVANSEINENQVQARVISKHPILLGPGQQVKFVIDVSAVPDAPLSLGEKFPAYSLIVTANGQQYHTSAFLISVVKKYTKLHWYCIWFLKKIDSCKYSVNPNPDYM